MSALSTIEGIPVPHVGPNCHYAGEAYLRPGLRPEKAGDKTGPAIPAVVNFHGGGFTLGAGIDDARFARFVLERCNAVFISVNYRLAPEYPFPTAVEDGADALLYVIQNTDKLRVDPRRIATSGFLAGGNLVITSPLRLYTFFTSEKGHQEREHRIAAIVP